MLRITDKEAISNSVPYLYTVAKNLTKEHAVLDHRQGSGVDIDEALHHEALETLHHPFPIAGSARQLDTL
jgi:hypothetical protein